MKIIVKILSALFLLLVVIVVFMFAFDICPPQGPWISPPWCASSSFKRPTYDMKIETSHLSQVKAVNMFDTWGRNYNFNMLENTRNDIESSFSRVAEMGAQEVYVHDFQRAVYNDSKDNFASLNYQIEDEVFLNDMRDESMTEEDLEKLVKAAHDKGLKLGIKQNMAFVDIGKYISKGLTGEIDSSVKEDYNKFNSSHSEEWVRDYFSKWEKRMLLRAELYNKHGVDIISLTPGWMGPTFQGQEALANELNKQLITNVRKAFDGQIQVELSFYGILDGVDGKEDWTKYDYYKSADIKEVRVYNLPTDKYKVSDKADMAQIQVGIDELLKDLDSWSGQQGIKLSIFFSPFSYPNAINNGIVEYMDVMNSQIKLTEKDWDHQAIAWQAFFNEITKYQNIERITANNFWWDDAMDPDVKVKISISPSFRNKPAEEVIKQWFIK
ncbi:MAG: hypothetical protein WCJ57_01355 [Candidatus Falkowbacteria bacterium]